MSNGANAWGVSGAKIGNGWKFPQVFAGQDGAIFAINDFGDLLYFNYLGMSDGSNCCDVTGAKIGNGWKFRQVFAEFPADWLIESPQPSEPVVLVDERCDAYARNAVAQFELTGNLPACRVHSDGRWQSSYQNHYQWCLTAPDTALAKETKIREDHLLQCGAQIRID